jgi:hypothetical protein
MSVCLRLPLAIVPFVSALAPKIQSINQSLLEKQSSADLANSLFLRSVSPSRSPLLALALTPKIKIQTRNRRRALARNTARGTPNKTPSPKRHPHPTRCDERQRRGASEGGAGWWGWRGWCHLLYLYPFSHSSYSRWRSKGVGRREKRKERVGERWNKTGRAGGGNSSSRRIRGRTPTRRHRRPPFQELPAPLARQRAFCHLCLDMHRLRGQRRHGRGRSLRLA